MIPEDARKYVGNTPVNFLWLELTNICNLQCRHCYAGSGPGAGEADLMTTPDYENIIQVAFKEGCRAIQFIGGEPTVNKELPHFIEMAAELGYDFIEVFTNLVRLPDQILEMMKKHNVHVATSMYSWNPETHDHITDHPGSFFSTLKNAKRIQESGIPLRVALIEMAENNGHIDRTIAFLKERGIHRIGVDKMRKFGRGEDNEECGMEGLCGNCAGGTICVGSDGSLAPCIMSKQWSVGSVLDEDYRSLIHSIALRKTRQRIAEATKEARQRWAQENGGDISACSACSPGQSCLPCPPNTNCPPNNCQPYY